MTHDARGSPEKPHVLVTGATGYIGGRLVPVLESAGVRLRCLARQLAALSSRVSPRTEIVAGDLLEPASLDRALTGIDVAYYLVHSMGAHGDYVVPIALPQTILATRRGGPAFAGSSTSAASRRATSRSADISAAGWRPARRCATVESRSWNFARRSSASQLLRRRRAVVGLVCHRGRNPGRMADRTEPGAHDLLADARVGRHAARGRPESIEARLPRVYRPYAGVFPLVSARTEVSRCGTPNWSTTRSIRLDGSPACLAERRIVRGLDS